MRESLKRIYKLKVTLVAIVTAVVGLSLLIFAKLAPQLWGWQWVNDAPLSELGSTLSITGLFVIAWDYVDGKDRERREDSRIRRLLRESAPAFRDAVIRGFSFKDDDLERIATPALLDDLINNSLALRLGDRQLATEVYADLRDQVIKSEERWHDARVTVDLSTDKTSPKSAARFVVTVKWEYTVVPKYATRSFANVSNRKDYVDLVQEPGDTSVWLSSPQIGINPADREAFELLQFSVDGEERAIRRSVRKEGQSYSVTVGSRAVEATLPVRVRYTYRTVTSQAGHVLHFDLEHPTRNVSLTLNYGDSGIAKLVVLDLIPGAERVQLESSPAPVPGKSVSLGLNGWAFPRTGFAFVWTLASETDVARFRGSRRTR